jgi:hypothetical protein
MTTEVMNNDFLVELLALQQDGRQAISAPTNWTHEPLLEVETEIDAIVNDLEDTILVGSNGNGTARWHFFIGSPGNGKSAAMGKLCRGLMSAKGCQVRDENNVVISELAPTAIPYALNVYENDNRYATAQIVQDASVVRNPFSPDVDPATELLRTMEHAWEKGISLVVCTNRGVLEKAHRDHHTNRDVNSKPWFKMLAAVVSAGTALHGATGNVRAFDGKKAVFREVKVGYSHLDNRSLLLGQSTFERLIQGATSADHWAPCISCASNDMCPFKANRDWLVDNEARTRVLRLLKRAEVLSGQVIVFREALAIISLVLAGCPRDYNHRHPCEWVREAIAHNDVFSLATRRIYMCLLASSSPHGLEPVVVLRKRQLTALRWLYDAMDAGNAKSRAAMKRVVTPQPPSTDVGVTRLLGAFGIMASLDPCRESLPADFYGRWDADFEAKPDEGGSLFTPIELACVTIWKELEECLELASEYSVPEAHWALRRWSSNFLLHFGSLIEGRSAWSKELDAFADLLALVATSLENRTLEQKRSIRQLDAQVESLLNRVAGRQAESTVQLSEGVTLSGQWVRDKLKPRTVASEESGSVSLAVEFEGGERAVFGAPMYLWLTRRADGKLDARCFPQELLSGATDARVRAASKGKYAFESNDVELVVDTSKGEVFRLARFDGEVDVSHD